MEELFFSARDGAKLSVLYYAAPQKNAPLLYEIHGGGFVYGRNSDDEAMCRALCARTGMNVASVDYRLAPKFRFPTAIYDCYDALQGLIAGGKDFDRSRIFTIGHSAGANAAVALAQLFEGLRGQILNYPCFNLAQNRRPYRFYSFLKVQLDLTARKYCPNKAERKNPLASPLFMGEEAVEKMPPTLMFICGRDSLRVDGIAFEKMLREKKRDVRLVEYERARHGFFERVPSGKEKANLITPKRVVREQEACYRSATDEILNFLKKYES